MKVFSKQFIKEFWKVIIATFSGFINDNGLKLSASLAYYTIFSMAPLLILIISLISLFFSQEVATNKLYPEMAHYLGSEAAQQIQDALKHLQLAGKSTTAVIIGTITLLLGASSIFIEIQ